MIVLAYPRIDLEPQEDLTVQAFMRATTNKTHRYLVHKSRPENLDEAVEPAFHAEAFDQVGGGAPAQARGVAQEHKMHAKAVTTLVSQAFAKEKRLFAELLKEVRKPDVPAGA